MKKKLFFVTLPLVASLLLSGCWNLNFDFDREEEEIAGFNKKFAEELEEHGYIRSAEKISPAEVAGIEELDLAAKGFYSGNLTSLKGIEFFTNLRILNCNFRGIEKLDLSKNTALEEVSVMGNELTELVIRNCQSLRYLDCSGNDLEELNTEDCVSLDTLDCGSNKLHSLNLEGNRRLKFLSCRYGGGFHKLDLSGNPELLTVDCTNTGLKELNVENCRKLEKLNCEFS